MNIPGHRTRTRTATGEGDHAVSTSRSRPPGPAQRPRHPASWLRLAATVAAPLALAGIAVPAAARGGHLASSAATTTAASTTSSSSGLRPLSLPGLTGRSATVTLITGDQVRLTQVSPGRYTATGVPGAGPATQIGFQGSGGPHGLSSLRAIPSGAAGLIGSGQANPGLFDVLWLARHGDTGPAARIPVTIQYGARSGTAAMRRAAARLPGATVLATQPGSRQVSVSVAARRAGAFWAALTGQPSTAQPTTSAARAAVAAGRPAGLTGGAARIWLTGHQTPGPATAPASTPMYTVTETITGSPAGSPVFGTNGGCAGEDAQGNQVIGRLCTQGSDLLWGVAGGGEDHGYSPATSYAGNGTCVSQTPAKPYPVCTAWQYTYSVPAGVYAAQNYGTFLTTDNPAGTLEKALAELDVPQFTVTGNTSITINAAAAQPVTVSTPQPTWHNGVDSMIVSRSTADNSIFQLSLEELIGGLGNNWWALPTPASERATIGAYHYSPELTLTAPMVTAAVTTPRGGPALHPVYPCDETVGAGEWCVRFSGHSTLPLVYAGQGTRADFAKIDAQGKLVLLRPCIPDYLPGGFPAPGGRGCNNQGLFSWQQLVNARKAGAAGVLLDAGTVGATGSSAAEPYPVPVSHVAVVYPGAGVPMPASVHGFPFAVIDSTEATTLRGLLAKGPVSVSIGDTGNTPYVYNLSFDQEAQILASQHYTLTPSQLAEVTESYHYPCPACGGDQHAAAPVGLERASFAFRPDDVLSSGIQANLAGPGTFRDYYGPLSPDQMWLQYVNYLSHQQGGPFLFSTGELAEVYSQLGAAALGWNEAPYALGAAAAPPGPGVQAAQPDRRFEYCAGCRQGNTFWPVFDKIGGANPSTTTGLYGFAPGDIHLYGPKGKQIPPTPYKTIATYQLPARKVSYKLVVPGTTWHFTSAEPATDQTPPGTGCPGTAAGVSTAPCQADPLVFLRYDAGLSAANTITPGVHQLQITGYHQDPSAPPVTSLQLWTSTDGGATWQPARVTGGRGGAFTASYTVPASGTNGHVSIKAQATDAAGNSITQQIKNAYAIAGATASKA